MSLTPGQCIRNVEALARGSYSRSPLTAFVVVYSDGPRSTYAAELAGETSEIPFVAAVVRSRTAFKSANGVSDDLRDILEECREQVELVLSESHERRLALVLISAEPVAIPQVASMLTLPEWFPHGPGSLVDVPIVDLAAEGVAPVDVEAICGDALCESLYRADKAVVRRLLIAASDDRRALQSFAAALVPLDGSLGKLQELLRASSQAHEALLNPTRFRPSVRELDSFGSLAARVYDRSTPVELDRVSKALASVLAPKAEDGLPSPALVTLVEKPSDGRAVPSVAFARGLLRSFHHSIQLLNIASHADQYPRFPQELARAISMDLQVGLRSAAAFLDSTGG